MKLNATQCVYVMFNPELNITKVGISQDPKLRKVDLEIGCGCDLILSYASRPIYNAMFYEKEVHKMLANKNKKGEWFYVTPDDAIVAIQTALKEAKADIIVDAYESGESISKIAEDNNVTRQAVLWRLRHLGVYNKEDKEFIRNTMPKTIKKQTPKIVINNADPVYVYLDEDKPKSVPITCKRIEPNIHYNGEWYQITKYNNGQFYYAYTRDIEKARIHIGSLA